MAIKITIALEVPDDDSRDAVLTGLRALLLQQRRAPKYKVKVSYETENEEIGDAYPLDLPALGVPLGDGGEVLAVLRPDTPLPMESYLNSLDTGS